MTKPPLSKKNAMAKPILHPNKGKNPLDFQKKEEIKPLRNQRTTSSQYDSRQQIKNNDIIMPIIKREQGKKRVATAHSSYSTTNINRNRSSFAQTPQSANEYDTKE
jgi:hypothetical protein